jgi:hypothetical protein
MSPDDFLKQFTVCPGRALVVGSKQYKGKADRRALYRDAIGLDLESGEGVDIVHDLEQPLPPELGQFAHIDCASVLEHVQRPWLMAANIEDLMLPGATLFISVPFVWRVHAYPSDYWRMTVDALPILFPSVAWQKRGYLSCGELHKKPPAMVVEGNVYLRKTEVVGFGVSRTDH